MRGSILETETMNQPQQRVLGTTTTHNHRQQWQPPVGRHLYWRPAVAVERPFWWQWLPPFRKRPTPPRCLSSLLAGSLGPVWYDGKANHWKQRSHWIISVWWWRGQVCRTSLRGYNIIHRKVFNQTGVQFPPGHRTCDRRTQEAIHSKGFGNSMRNLVSIQNLVATQYVVNGM